MDVSPAALSALLRRRRGELGMTQSELAERAGVGVRTLRDLEQGAVGKPRTASVRQLLAALAEPIASEEGAGLRIGVLGPLLVERDGRAVPAGDTRAARLLGLLALSANRSLSLASAAEALWGSRPPASHGKLVNRYVRQLRQLCGPQLRLSAMGGGLYRLDADPDQLDLLRFSRLTAQARADHEAGDLAAAYDTYRQALACWRGPVLGGYEQTGSIAEALSRQRLTAALAFADIGQQLGRHDHTIAALTALREDEPLHEGLHARLMTALAGDGQQAAALELYDQMADRLSAELSIEPGPDMRAAQLAVLRREEPAHGTTPGHNFLPIDVHDFVGREDEIDEVAEALLAGRGPGVHTLSGMPGIGKTAFAVRVAHRLAEWFPDGQLFVDLHTHSGEHTPLTARAALDALLRQLGVDGHRIPDRLDQSAALWRSLLASRSVLVVLDDVADAAQVRPLLPGGGANCQFLITSRGTMTSLDAVNARRLDVLPAPAAVDLFARVADARRVGAHLDEVHEIAQLCGFLPLAIRIAAARLRDRPSWTVTHLLSLLRDEHRRLPALSAGDRSVGAALTLSYRQLNPAQQRLFRLLGDFPGIDITAAAAAAITGIDEAAELLEDLVDVNLFGQHQPDRYGFHDLVRDHARETGRAEPAERRQQATDRTYAFYLHTAALAADLLEPTRKRFPITGASPTHRPDLSTAVDALAWFEAERLNLSAIVAAAAARGDLEQSWQLAQTLWRYFFIRGHLHVLIETHQIALDCTQRLGDTAAEAEIRKSLGLGYWRTGRPSDAIDQHLRALALDRAAHDTWGEAKTHNHLGFIHGRDGDQAAALDHHRRSAELYQRTGDRCGTARALVGLGDAHFHAGRTAESIVQFRAALDLARQVDDHWGEGLASVGLGFATRSRTHLEQALRLTRATGDRWGESMALTGLGMILSDANEAINHYRQAINLTQEVGDTWWERTARTGLTRLRAGLDRYVSVAGPQLRAEP